MLEELLVYSDDGRAAGLKIEGLLEDHFSCKLRPERVLALKKD